ncbi:MAG: Gfo/Idh/MocA family oxidoreductase [Thomasclavelia sp.]|nr:Gfo/Idh/MocA family oxidoreductase [Thomasclavelia sp.]
MKLGILGTGMIVQDLMNTFDILGIEDATILATESTIDLAKEMISKHKISGYTLDYDELLDSDVDTIYVALPNFLHYSFAKKALLKGKHVIIEKPITANSKELKDLITIAKKQNKIILEAMNIPYIPVFKGIQKDIGKVGKIKIVSMNYSQYSSRYNAFKQGQILPVFDYHKAGGALMDINVYNLSTVVNLFGQPKEVNYEANIEKGIDTSGILTLDYGTFKAVCIGAKDCQAPVVNTIQGDEGFIKITTPMSQSVEYEVSSNKGDKETIKVEDPKHRLYYEFIEFNRIINELDFITANKMLDNSLIVSKVMETARKQVNVIFDNDK